MINWRYYKWKLTLSRFISKIVGFIIESVTSHKKVVISLIMIGVLLIALISHLTYLPEPTDNTVGYVPGRGGYLEFSIPNQQQFDLFFRPYMPIGIDTNELSNLSTTFTTLYPNYRILPPKELWRNMLPTLDVLRTIRRLSDVDMAIASAYRSTYVNRKSSGANRSKHLDFSALDIEPVAERGEPDKPEFAKVAALLKHFWWKQGKKYNLGLGYYSNNRFHIDTMGYRRWKWLDTQSEAQTDYNQFYSQPLDQLLDP